MDDYREYDDFLGLSQIDFRRSKLIVFAGVSGSGKSTAMEFLRREHADFQDQPSITIQQTESRLQLLDVRNHLVLLDEVNSLLDFRIIRKLLRHNQVAVATHLPLAYYLPFKAVWPTKRFHTDRGVDKIIPAGGRKTPTD